MCQETSDLTRYCYQTAGCSGPTCTPDSGLSAEQRKSLSAGVTLDHNVVDRIIDEDAFDHSPERKTRLRVVFVILIENISAPCQ